MSSTHVQDDGFHEIQLNGKQLVFLFMAATVVSVVIFLCGVLVGRGVKTERAEAPASDSASNAVLPESPQIATPAPPPPAAQTAAAEPAATAPPPVPAEDDFAYGKLLDAKNAKNAKETLKAVPAPPPAAAAVPKTPPQAAAVTAVPKEAKSAEPPSAAAPAASAARGEGYAIQVAALREPGEADTIAKRLVAKGYDAYVLTPPGGTPNVYRVRVGSFKTRRDAEPVASKLQQEEQFKPWITR